MDKYLTLYSELKHANRKLTEDEIEQLVSLIDSGCSDYSFSLYFLCLGYGSNYLEENPMFFKKHFNCEGISDENIGELIKLIGVCQLYNHFADTLISFVSMADYIGLEHSSRCYWSIVTLSGYIFESKDAEVYEVLYSQYHFSKEKISTNLNHEDSDGVKDYLKHCYTALLFCLYGKESRRISLTEADMMNGNYLVSFPNENSIK